MGGGIWPPLGLQGAWLCDDGAFWETSWPDGTAHQGGAKVKSETTLQLILGCQLGTEEGGGGSLGGLGGKRGVGEMVTLPLTILEPFNHTDCSLFNKAFVAENRFPLT